MFFQWLGELQILECQWKCEVYSEGHTGLEAFLLWIENFKLHSRPRVHSSVVEHLTADQEVTGSNPVGPFIYLFFKFNCCANF